MNSIGIAIVMIGSVLLIILLAAWAVGTRMGLFGLKNRVEERKVSVLMLGYSEAGKTTFLTALYRHFSLGNKDGIRLCADSKSEVDLIREIGLIENSSGSTFLESTRPGNTRKWTFDVKMESGAPATAADLFTLEYLDYPGAYLDDEPEVRNPLYSQALQDADILLGMIDGDKLSRLMSNGDEFLPPADRRRFIREIENLLRELTRNDTGIHHLVISKWDLMQAAGGRRTVAEVIEYLEGVSEPFRNFRKSPRNEGLQLIPVAAFGVNEFVRRSRVQTAIDWVFRITRDPEKSWKPWNMEVPFFWLIPDVVQHAMKKEARGQGGKLTGITRYLIATLGLEITFQVVVPFLPVSVRASPSLKRAAGKIRRNPQRQGTNELKAFFDVAHREIREYKRKWPTTWLPAPEDAE